MMGLTVWLTDAAEALSHLRAAAPGQVELAVAHVPQACWEQR
jgi:hypothetical protein